MGINRPIFLTNSKKFQDIKNLELLKITPVAFTINLDTFDCLIFTSQNSVKFFAQQYPNWTTKPCFAISQQTAKTIESLGGDVFFVGKSGHGDEFALEIAPLLYKKNALYIRAKQSASDLEAILVSQNISCKSIIVYETQCIDNHQSITFPLNSIFIFTSPKNVFCFFKNFDWNDSFTAVCIGETTQKSLPEHIKNYTSQFPSIQSCITLAKSL